MPCYDSRSDPEYIRSEFKADIDKLTRLLCEACTMLELGTDLKEGSSELRKWWEEHAKWDEQRRKSRAYKP